MSSHAVCFKNLFSCLMYNLPVLTVMGVITALATTGYGAAYLIFGHMMMDTGETAHIAFEMLVYGFFGGCIVWLMGGFIFVTLPYLWKELCVIPKTIRDCVKCRG